MNTCRICQNPINAFMSFGKMPIANGFLTAEEFSNEYFFELAPAYCDKCQMFQLIEQPSPETMFHENYAFFSQTSKTMMRHFSEMAFDFKKNYLPAKNAFIVEIGSNDGILLQHFAKNNIKHLGIEPSKNVAQVAQDNGINTWCTFFNQEIAKQIVAEYGRADIITASNVMCHIPNLPDLAKGIVELLKPDGYLIFEDPYLGDVIQKTAYDQIYDEHVFLFSVNSVTNAFAKVGLEIVDVIKQATHGGSMRYVLAAKGTYIIHDRVKKQRKFEENINLHKLETYQQFKTNCEKSKENLLALLTELNNQKRNIVGYAATSKSTTIINYCNLHNKHLAYICDTTPIKQGKFSPGAHIPIKPYEAFCQQYPDYAVLFAWNHANEIFAKEKDFVASGGKWIMFVPEVKIL